MKSYNVKFPSHWMRTKPSFFKYLGMPNKNRHFDSKRFFNFKAKATRSAPIIKKALKYMRKKVGYDMYKNIRSFL